MTSQYYGSAEWLADVAREQEDRCVAGAAARASASADYARASAAHRAVEAKKGLCEIRARDGRIVHRYIAR